MADTVVDLGRRYVLEGTDQDPRRLQGISQVCEEMARAGFRRAGVQPGWNAIDCGCGPIGGLSVLAEMVGPGGRVVGVDFSESATQQARSATSSLGLSNVEVVTGDINQLDAAALGGPFDVAYTRLFMMHQANPVRTLRRIADLLRPGGWLVAQEALRTPPPRSHPDLEALGEYWELLHQVMQRVAAYGIIEDLPRAAREAGFEVCAVNGYFRTLEPEQGFELHASTLAAARERATRAGVATEQQVDTLLDTLRAARYGKYEWVSMPFFLDLTLRK